MSGFLPAVEERQAGEDQEEADGGAGGALEPDIYSEKEGACYEQTGDYGVAPAAIGAGEFGLGFAESEEGEDGEAVKNPAGKNIETREFFESAAQGHEAC